MNKLNDFIKSLIFSIIILASVMLMVFLSGEFHEAYAQEYEPKYIYDQNLFFIPDEEYEDILQVLHAEAGEQDYIGQMMVMETICNRTLYKEFNGDLLGVVSERGQFTTWKNHSNEPVMKKQIDVWENVRFETNSIMNFYIEDGKINGTISDWVTGEDYVYFCTPSAYERVGHTYMFNTFRYGGHIFGTAKGKLWKR